MNKMNKIKNIQDDDEIELFEMLQTLWDGKSLQKAMQMHW